ncbi:MAG: type I phosphomannose isomerase catalytic subunit [Vulcanimicrobiaceae bacterium]
MVTDDLSAYRLLPKLTPAVWGGDALVRIYGKEGDPHAKIGESWECWDTNRVATGPLAGATVAELRSRLGARLLGDLDTQRIFPVLTKFIDARDWLSVQVHPDDAYAQRVEHQPNGKTECWYVLHAEPGAEIVLGWARDTSRDEYESRVADATLAALLRRVPVHAGQAYYLPAGTLHAIGKGVVVYETQQASDLTYRIFDWNRIEANGQPRQLHVAKAADVLDYHAGRRGAIQPLTYLADGLHRTALIADPRFRVERVQATATLHALPTYERPLIVTALTATLDLQCMGEHSTLRPYQTALVPAAAESLEVRADAADADFLLVTLAAQTDAFTGQLLACGIARSDIDAFLAQFAPLHSA